MNSEESWVDTNGATLFTKTWIPNKIKATLTFFHGLGEHVSRYDHVFAEFAAAGIKTVGFDQRGFGRTARRSGILGHNEKYTTALSDAKFLSDKIRVPGIPHFIMGHSMGGGLCLRYALKYPEDLAGVISSAPALKPGKHTQPNPIEKAALSVLPFVLPTFCIKNPVKAEDVSRDLEVVRIYLADPYVHPWGSIQTFSDILKSGAELSNSLYKDFNLPLLVTHGSNDLMTDPEASKAFVEHAASSDKTFKSFEGYSHELHNEPGDDKEVVINLYIDWILTRSKVQK